MANGGSDESISDQLLHLNFYRIAETSRFIRDFRRFDKKKYPFLLFGRRPGNASDGAWVRRGFLSNIHTVLIPDGDFVPNIYGRRELDTDLLLGL
jgi:hypothetical protein